MLDRKLWRHAALFGLTLCCIQGSVYLLQMVAAAQLTAARFSQIRIVESLVAVLVLIETLGVPSASLPRLATARSDAERALLLRRCLAVVGVLSVTVSAGYAVALRFGIVQRAFEFPIWQVLLLSVLAAFRLLLVTTTQASQHFGRLAGVSVMSCTVAYGLWGLLQALGAVPEHTWLAARIGLEAVLCLLLLATDRPVFSATASRSTLSIHTNHHWILFRLAAPLGLSLLFRSAIEQGPILLLATLCTPPATIAAIGLLLTFSTISMIPAGILQGAILPRLSLLLASGSSAAADLRRVFFLFVGSGLLSVIVFVIIVVAARFIIPWLDFASTVVVAITTLVIALKSTSNALGAYLLTSSRIGTIFVANTFSLFVAMIVGGIVSFSPQPVSLLKALGAVAVVEMVNTATFIRVAVWRKVDRNGACEC